MIKSININSLLQAKKTLKVEIFKEFLGFYEIDIKPSEIEDLNVLVEVLSEFGNDAKAFDRFFVGYTIPQIGKEFDLLRFGPKFTISLEIKSESTEELIKKQLLRNKYYLGFLGKKVAAFSFISKSKDLYLLNDNNDLLKIDPKNLYEFLIKEEIDESASPNSLFNPTDYLVSPFNSPEKFLANEYFLTNQQEKVRGEIFKIISLGKNGQFISIEGGAGTGKTLLTYDIAKYAIDKKKSPLILHCGQLNSGHEKLVEKGWKIAPIKDYEKYDYNNFDILIVDEAQRIYSVQLEHIISKISSMSCVCIFSHDKKQVLSKTEKIRDASEKIRGIKGVSSHRLSEKIRTNKEIAAFIKMLFNRGKKIPLSNNGNIEINYFNNIKSAGAYFEVIDTSTWEILRFTPSQHDHEYHEKYSDVTKRTSHKVIGQEFENVLVTIDEFFDYDENDELIYCGKAYYEPSKMLFQNITRSRKRVNIVIINNEKILSRCLEILK